MKASTILINLLVILTLLAGAEVGYRMMGYRPGDLTPDWSNFKPVDSLTEYHHFITDSSGLVVANKNYFAGQGIYINQQGFRSKEFKDLDSAKEKILLIGDSYTWGLSAQPITNSFADIISKERKEEVINLGIPVADPLQYAALAQRYVSRMKPSKVFVFLYLGNDIMQSDRALTPYAPLYFYTSAGAIQASDGPLHFHTAAEAYHYFAYEKYWLRQPKNPVEWIIKQSAMLSRLYSFRYRWLEKKAFDRELASMSVTKKYLSQIISICAKQKSALRIVIIPELKEADRKADFFKKKYKALFSDHEIGPYLYLPEGNSKSNYTAYPDAHLNNDGHRFYAKEVLGLMK